MANSGTFLGTLTKKKNSRSELEQQLMELLDNNAVIVDEHIC
jgi:hypothetical protein